MSTELKYPGDLPGGFVEFDLAEWVTIQRDLVAAEALLRMFAQKYGWEVRGNIKGYWPARRIEKRSLTGIKQFVVKLDQTYLDDRVRRYVVVKSSRRKGFIRPAQSSFDVIARLDPEEMADIGRLRSIMEPILGPVG